MMNEIEKLNYAINILKNGFNEIKTLKKFFDLAIEKEAITDDEIESLKNKINEEEAFQKELDSWFASEGDKTHRLDYDLNQDSVIFDVGGYLGTWATSIYCRYRSKIYIFEPVKTFYDSICHQFKRNNDIKVFNFGLSDSDDPIKMSLLNDASSEFRAYAHPEATETVEMRNITGFMNGNKIGNVDLIKINIEGGEYALLNNLLDSGKITSFKNIQIQFHNFFPNAVKERNSIVDRLSLTHERTYCFEFVWENWKLK